MRVAYAYGTPEPNEVLQAFDIHASLVGIPMFKILRPDAFIWKLRIADGTYYLYAEDYSEAVSAIEGEMQSLSGNKTGHFVHRKSVLPLNESNIKFSGPERATRNWNEHPRTIQAESGFDKVYLYELGSDEEDW